MFGNLIKLLLFAVIVAAVALFAKDRMNPPKSPTTAEPMVEEKKEATAPKEAEPEPPASEPASVASTPAEPPKETEPSKPAGEPQKPSEPVAETMEKTPEPTMKAAEDAKDIADGSTAENTSGGVPLSELGVTEEAAEALETLTRGLSEGGAAPTGQ